MIELGQFYLGFGFVCTCPADENIENQSFTIDHFDFQHFLEIADLGGGEMIIKDDQVSPGFNQLVFYLTDFAFADEKGGIDFSPGLSYTGDHFSAS
jgi:hypothetical protein